MKIKQMLLAVLLVSVISFNANATTKAPAPPPPPPPPQEQASWWDVLVRAFGMPI